MTPRVLIVHGSLAVRMSLADAFGAAGWTAFVAADAERARSFVALEPLDALLLAPVLPDGDGLAIVRQARETRSGEHVAIALLSDERERRVRGRLPASETDAIFHPPYDAASIIERVSTLLGARTQRTATGRPVLATARESALRVEPTRALAERSEAAAATTAGELAETRGQLIEALERKNAELRTAYRELQSTQAQLVQSAKMASLGELVAGVAHEINNPLAFVLSHLDTARRSLANARPDPVHMTQTAREHWDRAQSRLAEMQLGLDRIRELVLKLRTFSRLDEGERKSVSIRECVESLLTILQHRLNGRISVETQYGEPDCLECHPSALTQAIMNLVSNSIDAIDGYGRIRIRTGGTADAFEIVVTDTGHGIPPQLRERVMEPFFTTKPIGQGTGLGLSIAYSIVRKHDGTLVLTEADGGGTSATIRIPRRA